MRQRPDWSKCPARLCMASTIAQPTVRHIDPELSSGFMPDWLATVWGVILTVALYRVAFTIAIAIASPPLGMDNVVDNVWAQRLQLVYQLRQPPLFDWLLWSVQQLTGTGALSFLLVKDLLMVLTAAFLWGAARFAIRDPRMAAL